MQHTSEELRAWFRNVQPLCVELFNAAHVMCGNYDMAEYALRSAILDVWLQQAAGGMGFRERLRGTLRREAFAAALSEDGLAAEADWPGPGELQKDDPVAVQLGQAPLETQRLVMLRHGCALPDVIAFDLCADFHDITAELMSQHHRVEMRPVVQHPGNVAPAYAGRPDPDLYRSRPHHRRFPVCIPDILIPVQYCRFHFVLAFFQ